MRQLSSELAFDNPDGGAWKQGWDVQPRPVSEEEPLTVLIVPHSHCDPGWIKTFDEYFQSQTKSIITTVINALLKDPSRTFIWAEISYFSWWWEEQDEQMHNKVRKLLDNKQLEFVTGGWVQPDEANSELYAMEVQLQEGHNWITNNIGPQYVPKYGWSIDPFGYSPTMPYLLKKYGFRAILIQRVHYAVKKELAKRKHLEFYWRQTWDKDIVDADKDLHSYDMMTHVMPFYSYDVPHTCGPDPSVCCQFDFHRSPTGRGSTCPWRKNPKAIDDNNVQERSMLILDQYRKKAALYRSNVVLIPLGDDFRYQTEHEAEAQYTNHKKIHDYINKNVPGVTVKFGTLSEYFETMIGQFEPPVLKGSFFTYSDVNEDYWSGYFTSRVFDKALDRQLERVLYAAESMGADKGALQEPRRALSLFQHHDGVTGTATDHVVEDYAKRIHDAIRSTQDWMLRRFHESFPQEIAVFPSEVKPCWTSPSPRSMAENQCPSEASVLVYNPLDTDQSCGSVIVPGNQARIADLPCEKPGKVKDSKTEILFDPRTGLMVKPIREQWRVWKVRQGGAYLFVPGKQEPYSLAVDNLSIQDGGYVVSTDHWKRTVIEKELILEPGVKATAFDFIYEVNLSKDNEEWFVRFGGDISNSGVFHTDLNGFNFDTHKFRSDMPIQSQVFPMPTLASIEDENTRMTVLSEHAQGTASLQEGSIDVWLDRRLAQDDNRGLGQGVRDNRPTRTRLRVLLEQGGYEATGEFRITKLARKVWQELQHPLEMYGSHSRGHPDGRGNLRKGFEPSGSISEKYRHERRTLNVTSQNHTRRVPSLLGLTSGVFPAIRRTFGFGSASNSKAHTVDNSNIPFVYLVYKRVDYLKKAIESLRKSDFPKSRVPIIISHDGRVPGITEYVESLKTEFKVIQLFHPHSCFEHQTSFPGNDTKLNENFHGDSYGNPRSSWVTCCKHHFTWLLKTVFEELDLSTAVSTAADGSPADNDYLKTTVDTFLFLEEDYVVAPTIYRAIINGQNMMNKFENNTIGGFFGVVLDPTHGNEFPVKTTIDPQAWYAAAFRSGPMTLSIPMYQRIKTHATEYCRFDDYNWDWSLVHLQSQKCLPHTVLMPSRPLAKHIGVSGGMHYKGEAASDASFERLETKFFGTKLHKNEAKVQRLIHDRGFGGWAHPADQEHCMQLLRD